MALVINILGKTLKDFPSRQNDLDLFMFYIDFYGHVRVDSVDYCENHPNTLPSVFCVSMGELIIHKTFQFESSTPSHQELQLKLQYIFKS